LIPLIAIIINQIFGIVVKQRYDISKKKECNMKKEPDNRLWQRKGGKMIKQILLFERCYVVSLSCK